MRRNEKQLGLFRIKQEEGQIKPKKWVVIQKSSLHWGLESLGFHILIDDFDPYKKVTTVIWTKRPDGSERKVVENNDVECKVFTDWAGRLLQMIETMKH